VSNVHFGKGSVLISSVERERAESVEELEFPIGHIAQTDPICVCC